MGSVVSDILEETSSNLSKPVQIGSKTMRRFCLGLLMALCLASPIKAWGGLFNRFNPSLMSDVYGAGSYGKQLYSAADGGKVNQVRSFFVHSKLKKTQGNPGKFLGNPEKSKKKLGEIQGKSRKNPGKIQGKSRENPGKIQGNSMEIQANPGKIQ